MYTIDFETEGIEGNPVRTPPRPVGVSIKRNDQPSEYVTLDSVENLKWLQNIWSDDNEDLLFQNAPFDLAVAEMHLGLAPPRWDRIHDTMFLVFFEDPYGHCHFKKKGPVRKFKCAC